MDVTIEEIGPCRNRIQVRVPAEKVAETFAKHYRDLRQSVQVRGFRPGKVPLSFLQKRFGEEVARQVKLDLVESSLREVFAEHKLEPVGEPEVDFSRILADPGQELAFEAVVEVRPTFALPEYRGMEVTRPAASVTEEDVARELERLRQRHAVLEPLPAGEAPGEEDLLYGTATLVAEGRTVFGDRNVTIGPRSVLVGPVVVPELRARALEAGLGGQTTFTVTLPRFHPEPDLRGKSGQLTLRIHEAKRPVLPPLDDAFAQALDFDGLAELRAELERCLQEEKEGEADRIVEERILDRLLAAAPFPLPEGLVHRELDRLLARTRLELELSGRDPAAIEEELGRLAREGRAAVARALRVGFLLEAVARKEKIFVTEEEVDRQLAVLAAREGRRPEELKEAYREQGLLAELRFKLREAKTRAFLREVAAVGEEGKEDSGAPPEKSGVS